MMSDVTRLLQASENGEPNAAEELLPLVYEELRKLAAAKMANESSDHTLQPTALVHEAWLKLVASEDRKWDGRGHFFAAAAEAMRRILIDRARRKRALRHGGGQERVDILDAQVASPIEDDKLLEVHEALDKLAAQNKIEAELVKLRYFLGMTLAEAAGILGISERSADNYWAHARAWLFQEIKARNR